MTPRPGLKGFYGTVTARTSRKGFFKLVNHLEKGLLFQKISKAQICFQINSRHETARCADAEAAQGRAGHWPAESQRFLRFLEVGDGRTVASEQPVCCLFLNQAFT